MTNNIASSQVTSHLLVKCFLRPHTAQNWWSNPHLAAVWRAAGWAVQCLQKEAKKNDLQKDWNRLSGSYSTSRFLWFSPWEDAFISGWKISKLQFDNDSFLQNCNYSKTTCQSHLYAENTQSPTKYPSFPLQWTHSPNPLIVHFYNYCYSRQWPQIEITQKGIQVAGRCPLCAVPVTCFGTWQCPWLPMWSWRCHCWTRSLELLGVYQH